MTPTPSPSTPGQQYQLHQLNLYKQPHLQITLPNTGYWLHVMRDTAIFISAVTEQKLKKK